MNRSTFISTGGYPLKSERLQELQTSFLIFNEFAALAGDLTIISGCKLTGTTVGNGYININNEILEFREADGSGTPNVIIIEEPIFRSFKNGVIKQVYTIRYATFGTNPDESWPWSDFEKIDPIKMMMQRLANLEKKNAVFQQGGGMVLWNKPASEIPDGWQEVVDWRGRMPVGFDSTQVEFNAIGKSLGSKKVKLTAANIPELEVKIKKSSSTSGGVADNFVVNINNNVGETTLKVNAGSANTDVNILNPYRVVMFIEFIG